MSNIENMKEFDISTEFWREYDYGEGRIYHIANPVKLFLKEGSTGHRILDNAGVVHWVPTNIWHCIRWSAPSQPVSF
jgi:hypothetical protein